MSIFYVSQNLKFNVAFSALIIYIGAPITEASINVRPIGMITMVMRSIK